MPSAAGPWRSGIEGAWSDLGAFVPRLGLALGVLAIGWVLAIVLRKLADLMMERSASSTGAQGRVVTVSGRARQAVPRLMYLGVLLVACWTAVEVLDPDSPTSPGSDFVDALRALFALLGTAAVIVVSAILVVGVGGGLVRPMERRWERGLARVENRARRPRPRPRPGRERDVDHEAEPGVDQEAERGARDAAPVGASDRDQAAGRRTGQPADTPTGREADLPRDDPAGRPQPPSPGPATTSPRRTDVLPVAEEETRTFRSDEGAGRSHPAEADPGQRESRQDGPDSTQVLPTSGRRPDQR